MNAKKERYKKNLKVISDEAMVGLHPIAKKSTDSLMDLLKEFAGDVIEEIFNSKKKKGNK